MLIQYQAAPDACCPPFVRSRFHENGQVRLLDQMKAGGEVGDFTALSFRRRGAYSTGRKPEGGGLDPHGLRPKPDRSCRPEAHCDHRLMTRPHKGPLIHIKRPGRCLALRPLSPASRSLKASALASHSDRGSARTDRSDDRRYQIANDALDFCAGCFCPDQTLPGRRNFCKPSEGPVFETSPSPDYGLTRQR
jgi:hypothetical protein